MSYLAEAHARLIGKLQADQPPKFELFNSPDTFEFDAANHIAALTGAVNDYLHSLAIELAAEGASINPKDYIAPLADTASDLTVACNDRANDMREEMAEAAQ